MSAVPFNPDRTATKYKCLKREDDECIANIKASSHEENKRIMAVNHANLPVDYMERNGAHGTSNSLPIDIILKTLITVTSAIKEIIDMMNKSSIVEERAGCKLGVDSRWNQHAAEGWLFQVHSE
ncbi:hypothetical protein E2562_013198 [Oryza meyeriana var. granulata]|uniref:Uncharacterized protein n=1 Tax=Oryza meyeriana var. granulata TaxID=110450 RepID=A0A6G1DIJ1_9ORYZ|nr:hypothetical protein E2562_013198 [Oryza meyeriana var. granulata]